MENVKAIRLTGAKSKKLQVLLHNQDDFDESDDWTPARPCHVPSATTLVRHLQQTMLNWIVQEDEEEETVEEAEAADADSEFDAVHSSPKKPKAKKTKKRKATTSKKKSK